MATKLDKYLEDAQILLNTLNIEYKEVGVKFYDSIAELRQDMKYDVNFFLAIDKGFQTAFGWEMCRYGNSFYMIKKTSTRTICIDVELGRS